MPHTNSSQKIIVGMIVKNEAQIIERCLNSVLPYADYLVVIDTGSTDDTKSKIRGLMADSTVEYTLLDEPWVNFAHNRNALLDELQSAAEDLDYDDAYFLLVDADMEISGEIGDLTAGCYMVKIAGGFEWWMPYLVQAGLPWRYHGVTHEFLACEQPHDVENHPTLRIHHHSDGGTRPEKFTRDLALLEREAEANPEDPRTLFYLAQTYLDLGQAGSALKTYRRYLEFGTWDQEVYWAKYQVAKITGDVGDYLAAWSFRPSRAEAFAEAIRILNEKQARLAAYALALQAPREPSTDILFVHRDVESFSMLMEVGVALWWGGDKASARSIFQRLADDTSLDQHQRDQATANLAF
jgi:glycosyltransferase involved in cell wall biosynthesis